jgi:hypothetical protein
LAANAASFFWRGVFFRLFREFKEFESNPEFRDEPFPLLDGTVAPHDAQASSKA